MEISRVSSSFPGSPRGAYNEMARSAMNLQHFRQVRILYGYYSIDSFEWMFNSNLAPSDLHRAAENGYNEALSAQLYGGVDVNSSLEY